MLFVSMLQTQEFARAAVKVLLVEFSVSAESCTRILQLCEGLEELSLHIPVLSHHTLDISSAPKPFLPHLYKFYLKSLTVNLSTIFADSESVYLPRVPLFKRITHLHITNTWILWGRSTGIDSLVHLTHLSVHVNTSHMDIPQLRILLLRDNLQVLVLWRREPESYQQVQCSLSSVHILDPRVVIMNSTLFREYVYEEHAFWDYIDAVVSWQKATMGKIS
jgi:hypothetical protein